MTILIAEDEPTQRHMLKALLEKRFGYQVVAVENGQQAVALVEASPVEEIAAVILDVEMPVMDGFSALRHLRHFRPDLPVLMLTGHGETAMAVKAIKEGASDFIVKPPEPAHLDIALKNAMRISALSQELRRLKRDKEGALAFSDLVGHLGGLKEAAGMGRRAAASDVPVLLIGETGVGKELFARAIHGESRRVGAPFLAINCGAMPANLIESVLFGHERGAFTGAIARTIGKFREAEGGTLFLDEVAELPLEAQTKLLRVLQQKEVEPVGATRPLPVNVRVISATHRDLRQAVREGRFREDLYFRLNVLPITLPPLRERRGDILPLAEYFLQRIASGDQLPLKSLNPDALQYLKAQHWPGNVRELENLLHRALVLSEQESITRPELERLHDQPTDAPSAHTSSAGADLSPAHLLSLLDRQGIFRPMAMLEAEAMEKALQYFEGNVTRAAEALGIAKSTFYRKRKL